jgi:hypothetical protein
LGVQDRFVQEAFPPDCTEPFLFVKEKFDKDLQLFRVPDSKTPFRQAKAWRDILPSH